MRVSKDHGHRGFGEQSANHDVDVDRVDQHRDQLTGLRHHQSRGSGVGYHVQWRVFGDGLAKGHGRDEKAQKAGNKKRQESLHGWCFHQVSPNTGVRLVLITGLFPRARTTYRKGPPGTIASKGQQVIKVSALMPSLSST